MDSVTLCSKIQALRSKNAYGQSYVPELSLFRLITHDAVHAELKRGNVSRYLLDELTTTIITSARKVFSILVLVDNVGLVEDFMEDNWLQDHCLPLSLDVLANFGDATALKFRKWQWEFLSPKFNRTTIYKTIASSAVLPFLADEKFGDGGFGTVYKISLDPDHQAFEAGFPKQVLGLVAF